MIINLIIIASLQLATTYCSTFNQYLGVQALFGIGMGGIWGLGASMGLESALLPGNPHMWRLIRATRHANGSSWAFFLEFYSKDMLWVT
jgi:hypothetical protein